MQERQTAGSEYFITRGITITIFELNTYCKKPLKWGGGVMPKIKLFLQNQMSKETKNTKNNKKES